jgi:amidase
MTQAEHTAAGCVASLAAGELSAVELAQRYQDRIAALNPQLCAVLAIAPDVLAQAAASDARRAADRLLGPLDGVPVLIKDNIEAVGLPATAGSRALVNSPPAADAPVVRRLREAGLVVLGAANLSEWANFRSSASTSGWSAVGGQTRNPHDPDRNTSGSSSGSAAAIAAGLAPLAVGTETDGSIVSPAGVCGVAGFKPTVGTVPGAGIVPISSRQDTAGPMARTVADVAALFAVLAGRPDQALPPVALRGLPVAVWRPDGLLAEVAGVLDAVEQLLTGAGARTSTVTAASSGPFDDAEFEALLAEFAEQLPAYLAARPGDHPRDWAGLLAFNRSDDVELAYFSDEIFQRCAGVLADGGTRSARYRQARADCDAGAATGLATLLDGADFAIAPTNAPAWPIEYGVEDDYRVLTSSLCAVTGSPSISLPAGEVRGLPVGISVLGRRGQDAEVLAFAAALERLLPKPAYPLD